MPDRRLSPPARSAVFETFRTRRRCAMSFVVSDFSQSSRKDWRSPDRKQNKQKRSPQERRNVGEKRGHTAQILLICGAKRRARASPFPPERAEKAPRGLLRRFAWRDRVCGAPRLAIPLADLLPSNYSDVPTLSDADALGYLLAKVPLAFEE